MKIFNFLLAMFTPSILILSTGCSNECDEPIEPKHDIKEQAYKKYIEYSSKPFVSMLDISRGNISRSSNIDYNIGLTQDDIDYLSSLNEEELLEFRQNLIIQAGFHSEADYEAYVENIYDNNLLVELIS